MEMVIDMATLDDLKAATRKPNEYPSDGYATVMEIAKSVGLCSSSVLKILKEFDVKHERLTRCRLAYCLQDIIDAKVFA